MFHWKLLEKFHSSVRDSWKIKKNMSNVMNKELDNRFDFINKSIPNNWIRLLGAGSGGYFLVSIKDDINNPEELLNSKGLIMLPNTSPSLKSGLLSLSATSIVFIFPAPKK